MTSGVPAQVCRGWSHGWKLCSAAEAGNGRGNLLVMISESIKVIQLVEARLNLANRSVHTAGLHLAPGLSVDLVVHLTVHRFRSFSSHISQSVRGMPLSSTDCRWPVGVPLTLVHQLHPDTRGVGEAADWHAQLTAMRPPPGSTPLACGSPAALEAAHVITERRGPLASFLLRKEGEMAAGADYWQGRRHPRAGGREWEPAGGGVRWTGPSAPARPCA